MTNYIVHNLWLLWTLVGVMALILEVTSGTFYLLCFALGAVCSVIAALMGLPLWVQVLVFAIATVLSVFALRPLAVRYLHTTADERLSNADALIGREGRVIEKITEGGPGYVRIDGDEWKAVSNDGTIEIGEKVKVVSRESIVITVERLKP